MANFLGMGKKNAATPAAVAPAAVPRESAPVGVTEVFTPSVPAERGFVGRKREMKDLRQKGLNVPGTQVIVWGESGAGKSSLVNKVLEDAGRTAVKTACTPDSTYEKILEAAFAGTGAFYIASTGEHIDVTLAASGTVGSDLIGAKVVGTAELENGKEVTRLPITQPQLTPQNLLKELGARNLSWVIEDFHKVPRTVRTAIAHALKVFSDDGSKYSHTTVIVLGVAESVEELVAEPTNVGKRLIDIEVPPLQPHELGKILDAGEALLNLDFSAVRDRLLATSVGTASITHALALACCDEREIERSSPERVQFSEDDFEKAVAAYARTRSSTLKARFRSALVVHRKRKYANTEIILRALTQLPEDGGTVGDVMAVIKKTHPTYPYPNLTKYLLELQGEERGALIRKTPANKYRFDEPLQHAFAKSHFGLTAAKDGGHSAFMSAWDEVLSSSSVSWVLSFSKALTQEVEDLQNDDEDDETDSDEWEPETPADDAR